ncbi:MAG: GNAT family N-acetyltransferase [Candidatus Aenigmarchaeota archaeon]|nr:GNAT family N-acetyltransferase [Candidatus Aenigmarchaeota archaeon]
MLTLVIDTTTIGYHWLKEKIKKGYGKEAFPDVSELYDEKNFALDNQYAKPKKDITVVISAHNNEKIIERSIRDIFNQEYPIKNVYISDSNLDGTKGLVEYLKEEFPKLNYWSKKGITSKGEKINHMVKDPNVDLGDYVYFIDSGAKPYPDAIEKIADGFTEDNVAAVTSYGYVTPPDSQASRLFHYGKEWVNRVGKFRKIAQQQRRAVFVLCGAAFIVRSDIIKENEVPTNTLTEDTAFTWMLQEKGYKVGFVPESIIYSKDVPTLKAQIRQTNRWYTGIWQNIYLHAKNEKLFGPRSKAKALAWSSIAPGLLESLMYSGSIVSLPFTAYFNQDYAVNFLIADTALSFAAPIIGKTLSGEFKQIPKEIYNTLKLYPQLTTYKLMASTIWFSSGFKTAYDIFSGKSKQWGNTWGIESKKDIKTRFVNITPSYMHDKLDRFYAIETNWTGIGEEPWNEKNFMLELPKKWELSFAIENSNSIVGYIVGSQFGENRARVNKILVDKKFRQKGFGEQLIKKFEKECIKKGIDEVELKALFENEPANAFYTELGYQPYTFSWGDDGKLRNVYEKKLK